MKELQALINDKVETIINSGEIEKKIEEALNQSITTAITRQMESYGNFTKQLNDFLDESFKLDTSKVEIPEFTTVMSQVVNNQINKFFEGQAAERFANLVNEKLAPLPQEIPIHEFVNNIVSYFKSDDPCNCNDDIDEYATVEFESCGYSSMRELYNLKIWKKKQSSYSRTNDPDVYLVVDVEDGTIRGRHHAPYYIFDADAYIFKAYAQNIKLTGLGEFDPEDDCDLQLISYEY